MVTDLAPRGVEQLKKKLAAIFRKQKLEITIEANKKHVEFLDIYMDLEKEEFGPFMKQNDVPVYVDAGSNHPPQVLENIPLGRVAQEDDVSTAVAFLAANSSNSITGTSLMVDGGWTAKE